MSTKTYTVQTWDADGALKNHYDVTIATAAELKHLKKFLSEKSAHVVITPKPAPRAVKGKR